MTTLVRPIILFDGYCNFCSSTIDLIIKYDKGKRFLFAASQQGVGLKLVEEYQLQNVDSVILIYKNKVYRYSTAILKICWLLGLPFNLFAAFLIVPPLFRNLIYKWIAKNRYKWFGKRSTCKIPDQKEKDRFI